MATHHGCFVASCILALFVQTALSCCGGCGVTSSGGNFAVTSFSPTAPVGIAICSENVYEGNLCVQGNLPLLGSAALEGEFGTTGVGEVCYKCGDGDVGIDSIGCSASNGCCNKCGCSNAGCGINIGSCSCDLGNCCGNAGCNNAGCCCSNIGSCCDNCRFGSINIGSCCNNCDCNNAGGCCSNIGSCNCDFGNGCGWSNTLSCCDNIGCCSNSISLNIRPDFCLNLSPLWNIDPSSICLCSGLNIDNGPSSCCQCSNGGFNIDKGLDCCKCQDCCRCQDCCQCSSNGLTSKSIGSGNGFSNSNSISLLKRFGLSGCWYPNNMYSSPFARRLHELLHGNDCDCGCNGFGGLGCGCCG